ncbi:MAG: hypothetical protein F4W90_09775 [Gammaproteobacteria bacterium]|nr:hypothetical protein [Gammaproteobacteria bacterium]
MTRTAIFLNVSFVFLFVNCSLHGSEPVFEHQVEPLDIGVFKQNRIRFTVTGDAMEKWYGGFNIHITRLRNPENELARFNAFENLKEQIDLANASLPTHALNYMKPRVLIQLENPEFCDDEPESGRTYMQSLTTSNNLRLAFIWYQCFEKYDLRSPDNFFTTSHLMIHELAHVWDFLVFNFRDPTVHNYFRSISTCLYRELEDPYWRTNAREFFAQMTVSHFYRSWEPPETVYSLPWDVRQLIYAAWSEAADENVRKLRELAIC